FDRGVHSYGNGVHHVLRRKPLYLVLFGLVLALMVWLFTIVPPAFLPEEDQAVLFVQVQTPVGSTVTRTDAVINDVRDYLLTEEKDSVQSVFSITGFNFAGRGQNSAMAFIGLKPWDQREGDELSVSALQQRAQKHFDQYLDAMVFAFAPPAVMELGNSA